MQMRLDNRGDIQQMRAQPALSEARRPAAQLVAYGGSRTGSMHEDAHPGQNATYPAHTPLPQATRVAWAHHITCLRRVAPRGGRQARPENTTMEPIIQERILTEVHREAGGLAAGPPEPEATRRAASAAESSR